jgi:hypothetical protein
MSDEIAKRTGKRLGKLEIAAERVLLEPARKPCWMDAGDLR